MAADFADDLIQHHSSLMANSIAGRDAVIRKMVSLIALAYGISPTKGKSWSISEEIIKLAFAMSEIEDLEKAGGSHANINQ